MISKLMYALIWVAVLSMVLTAGELFLLRKEIQGAFDRSVNISSDQVVYEDTPDYPINAVQAESEFIHFLTGNLNLDQSLQSISTDRKIRYVEINEFRVFNVFSSTLISIENPINGQLITGEINRPSVV